MDFILTVAVLGVLAVAGYFVVCKVLPAAKAATIAPVSAPVSYDTNSASDPGSAPVSNDTTASAPVTTAVPQAGTTATG
jgi:hypothetical protein